MILTYIVLAALLCVATLAARGSARRLVAAGALGVLIVYFVHPLAQLTGAYSRHLVAPTPFGFSLVEPQFWLMVVAAIVVLVTFFAREPNALFSGLAGVFAGITVLILLFTFSGSEQKVVGVSSIPWVLEVLIPLISGVVTLVVARLLLKSTQVVVAYGISALVVLGVGLYTFSSTAPETFDALRNYYRIVVSATPAQENLVVEDWRKDLEFNNQERERINSEWTAIQKDIEEAEAALVKAQEATKNSLSLGGSALEFAQNAEREAGRSVRDAYAKRELLSRQRAEYGITDPNAKLEPLTTIAAVSELPKGYSVGRDAGEADTRRVFPTRATYGFGTMAFFGILLFIGGAALLLRGAIALEPQDLATGALLAVIVAVLGFGFNAVEFDLGRFIRGFPFIQDFGRRAVPPDWNGILSEGLKAMTITIATAMIGTFIAAILALPSSFLAARNLTEKSWWGRLVYPLMRGFYNLDRGVDTLILALVFVAAVGLGPLAGVLAMGIHSMADLGKLYSEAIENAEKGPIEALEASGAPGTSIIRWGVLPQVLPLFVSYTLYRFEINFRVSIILGFVGAGGVGFLIQETMRSGKYNQMIILVGLVVLMVNVLDFISANVRRRLVGN
ncbi:MAG: phosphonate ABC transporter, permease protein PhnE [Deinococcales bacterium]